MIALACVQYISYMCAVLYVIRVRVVMTACIIKTRMDSHGIDSLGVTGGEGVSVNAAREPFLFTHTFLPTPLSGSPQDLSHSSSLAQQLVFFACTVQLVCKCSQVFWGVVRRRRHGPSIHFVVVFRVEGVEMLSAAHQHS